MSATDPSRDTYVSLATFRRNGKEVRTPVWIAGEGNCFYVFSEGDAGKVKRIRATGRVRVAACNVRGGVHGDWRDGSGRIVTDAAEIERAYTHLDRKYGWQMRLANFFSRLSGRYHQRAVLAIELS